MYDSLYVLRIKSQLNLNETAVKHKMLKRTYIFQTSYFKASYDCRNMKESS